MDPYQAPDGRTLVIIGAVAFFLLLCCSGACMVPLGLVGVPRGGARIRR